MLTVRFGSKPEKLACEQIESAYPSCVDGSELARTFFTNAGLVGAPMCSAYQCGSHDRWP